MRSSRSVGSVIGPLRQSLFRALRGIAGILPGGRVSAFGTGPEKIGAVLIINLDRQPQRLRRTLRELGRFRTADGRPLSSIAKRLSAVDARDGREVASSADVDPHYSIGDQLFVQPDERLAASFDYATPITMTRQEIAVARSHIEAWKAIAAEENEHVLIVEDDIWFRRGASGQIENGWREAWAESEERQGPQLLYFSFEDAGGTAERLRSRDHVFSPARGLWLLSAYVLSRKGARALLRAMPVVGPVDLWMNYRLRSLDALALSRPAIYQRQDQSSDNSHSILPFLARAGVVDGNAVQVPHRASLGPIFAWSGGGERDGLAMALSMLGLRVRVFDKGSAPLDEKRLAKVLEDFDAVVDAPLSFEAYEAVVVRPDSRFILEEGGVIDDARRTLLPPARTSLLPTGSGASWIDLCTLLDLMPPPHPLPVGPPRSWRLFRDDRASLGPGPREADSRRTLVDESPWAMVPRNGWPPIRLATREPAAPGRLCIREPLAAPPQHFRGLNETFPGNLAEFCPDAISYRPEGAYVSLSKSRAARSRAYSSGAFASIQSFGHGRFEAEIKAARGVGLVTGFFLHRDSPRQEIDVELVGNDPTSMLANVYFNPGDDGARLAYGYRGTPCRIPLGFDATEDFHNYAVEWRPDVISWIVDGVVVHSRRSWDPTPIPHLAMRVHANLWAPRSTELAGAVEDGLLPAECVFRNIKIWQLHPYEIGSEALTASSN